MALSWVIGTLSLAVVELSVLQGEREHVLRQERDSESEMWRAWCPEQAGRAEAEHGTHNVGALGLEGIGATHIQVGCVIGLQEADEVETLRLGKKWIQVKNENGDPDQHCIKGSQEPWGKCVP